LRKLSRILDFPICDNTPLHGIHEEHLAGLQPPFHLDFRRWDFQHPGLRGHDHGVVLGHEVTSGPQAVTVEHCADHATVGKRHRRRSIPRLISEA